ncbi:carbohydrate ABC transporter permease [Rhizobium laguerreae]|uniref:sn-glycerol-3-phosphate transport system permease protein UgpE n=4 Tax=Rhizobium TaxID=379 RepID=A0AB35FCF9_9HYPH|nr:binding-protein-dependent transport systems inner membrane component [Rhizobium leguminosarum bv. trifolii WSM1325]ASR10249.1 carbohydrate ABC transporter permease [Rhizobium leguminosarum bv. viciae]EJC64267.1 ABC-type sugar transport system, permease component [Rhizobium leguminosarum bv. viciae WSM1455]MBY2925291.1 carbohydrate ABC transporter permease [Rhizobium leguminosarum]MBY3064265.1 carbohydrate ABC transporter permease [Rhizobium laguerreae]NNU64083.1 carbohydrate ABC transporter
MRSTIAYRMMIWTGVVVLLIWSLGPIYWTIASSVTPSEDFSTRPINFFPQHFTLDHYSRLLGINIARIGGVEVFKQFRAALLNSVVTSIAATLLCVAISSLGAYAFTRLQFPGRKALFVAVVATLAIPAYAVLIPLYQIMIKLHLVDTYLGVSLIYVSAFLPLSLWLLRSVFEALPIALEEAAQLDGAGRLYIFFNIVLPLAGPGLTAAAILTFLGAWGQYLVPLIFSPQATKPLTVLIPEFVTKNFIDYGLITASGSIAIVIPALVVIFLNRYLVSGLLAGSVK